MWYFFFFFLIDKFKDFKMFFLYLLVDVVGSMICVMVGWIVILGFSLCCLWCYVILLFRNVNVWVSILIFVVVFFLLVVEKIVYDYN